MLDSEMRNFFILFQKRERCWTRGPVHNIKWQKLQILFKVQNYKS